MSYLGKLSPAVGNGLGGLPERGKIISTSPTNDTYTDYIVNWCNASPYIKMHKRVGDTLVEITNFGITLASAPTSILFSPLGTYLVITRSTAVDIYRHTKGSFTLLTTLTGWTYQCYNSSWSVDEKFLAIGTNESSTTNNIKVYTVNNNTFTPVTNLTNQISGVISKPRLSSDGTYIAVTSDSNANGTYGLTVYKWNGSSYTYLTQLKSGFAASADGGTPLFVENDSQLIVTFDSITATWKRVGDTFTALTSTDNSIIGTTSSGQHSPKIKNGFVVLTKELYVRTNLYQLSKIKDTNSAQVIDINAFGTYTYTMSGTNPYYLTMGKINSLYEFTTVAVATSGFTGATPIPTVATIKD